MATVNRSPMLHFGFRERLTASLEPKAVLTKLPYVAGKQTFRWRCFVSTLTQRRPSQSNTILCLQLHCPVAHQ